MKETPFEVKGPFLCPDGIFVIMKEYNGPRLCHVFVNPIVAASMAVLNAGQKNITHKLMLDTLEELGYILQKIVIAKIIEGNRYKALLYFNDICGVVREMDSGPTDAICLALTKGCPMLINDEFLQVNEELTQILKQAYDAELHVLSVDKNQMTDQNALDLLMKIDPDKLTKQ